MRILGSLNKAGHHTYMDNYDTSPSLFVDMKLKGLGACRIALVDSIGMPLEWKSKAKCKGQTGQIRKGLKKGKIRTENVEKCVLALQWKDKQLITILSTVHDSREATNG